MANIELPAARIGILNQAEFSRLCNDLFSAELSKLRLPQRLLEATDATTARDQGIDCRITCPDSLVDDWLPPGRSAWQFKSGDCPPATEIAQRELVKPGVLEVIRQGDSYCFVTADDITPDKGRRIQAAIDTVYAANGQPSRGRVYQAKKLARWTGSHLAIASTHFGIAVEGWEPFDQWQAARRYQNEFFADAAVTATLEDIRLLVERDGQRFIHVVGKAGAGKSRGVMEALRQDGLRQRTLYLPDAASFNPNFFWHLRQLPESSSILAIDECTGEHISRIRDAADSLPQSCLVIAVGPVEQRRAPAGALLLGGLAVDQIVQILQSFVPGVAENVLHAVAERCGGSPKLAVDLAQAAGTDPTAATWRELEQNADVIGYLNRRVFPVDSLEPQARVMRAISMFTRVGWFDEVSDEGRTAVQFSGVDWDTGRLAAERLLERGVVSRRGRYLYPTPDILANYLTRETLRTRTPEELSAFFHSLSADAQRAFAERLRQLGDDAETRDAVTRIIGDGGFFLSLEDLADESKARLLRVLVPAFPKLTVDRLEQIIKAAAVEDLRSFTTGRREIIWALQEVAWWPEYFVQAAGLLLRLALAENEGFANNATGVWTHYFQVLLGSTGTPYAERVPALNEALRSADPEARRLAALAISAALQTGTLFGMDTAPTNTGRLPPADWQPATYDEWGDILRDRLSELNMLLEDPDERVRAEAIKALHERGGDLIRVGLFPEWQDSVRRLVDAPFSVRQPILEMLSWQTENLNEKETRNVSPEDLELLFSEIAGGAFRDRLRLAASPWDTLTRHRKRASEDIPGLAREIVAKPSLLDEEFAWLFSGEANSGFTLGRAVGELDPNTTLLDLFLQRWTNDYRDDRFITGYLQAQAESRGTDWLIELLELWKNDQAMATIVANTIWRLVATDRTAAILAELLQKGWLSPRVLGHLTAGFWSKEVSPQAVELLLRTVSGDSGDESVSSQLAFLEQYLRNSPQHLSALSDDVMRLLHTGAGLEFSQMDSYHWGELAALVVKERPIELARICMGVLTSGERRRFRANDEIQKLLATAIDVGGWAVFEQVIGPVFEANPRALFRLGGPFSRQDFLTKFPVNELMAWIERDPEKRLSFVAHSVPISGEPLNPHARELLVRWGDRKDVLSALAATFGSEAWWGPESGWLRGKIEKAKVWAADPEPNVRRWAQMLIASYEARLQKAVVFEEEERH